MKARKAARLSGPQGRSYFAATGKRRRSARHAATGCVGKDEVPQIILNAERNRRVRPSAGILAKILRKIRRPGSHEVGLRLGRQRVLRAPRRERLPQRARKSGFLPSGRDETHSRGRCRRKYPTLGLPGALRTLLQLQKFRLPSPFRGGKRGSIKGARFRLEPDEDRSLIKWERIRRSVASENRALRRNAGVSFHSRGPVFPQNPRAFLALAGSTPHRIVRVV